MNNHKRSPWGTWKCNRCGQIFETRAKLFEHGKIVHPYIRSWNKGLTKETSSIIANQAKRCHQHYADGKFKVWCDGQHLSDNMKDKISRGMKKAHAEGRAHNIGESRWNNEHSYPEKFFKKVIENEFDDTNFIQEYPVSIYSIDFAWVDKKKAIEIDGEQHVRTIDNFERDIRKDRCLFEHGWKVLRIPWKFLYDNPKKYISIANDFVNRV